jgi:hypothetical protein
MTFRFNLDYLDRIIDLNLFFFSFFSPVSLSSLTTDSKGLMFCFVLCFSHTRLIARVLLRRSVPWTASTLNASLLQPVAYPFWASQAHSGCHSGFSTSTCNVV